MKDCTYQNAYKRLSIHYFFYFAVLGILLPYFALYLRSLDFTPVQIGHVLATMLITKVIAPNIWGWLADRSGRVIFWVRLATFMSFSIASLLLVVESYWAVLLTVLGFSFFWHASLPQFESYTLGCLAENKHRYGLLRLWGSVGFIVSALLVGWQIERVDIDVVPFDIVLLLLLVWLSGFLFRERKAHHEEQLDQRFFKVLKRPEVLGILAVSFLVQFSHGVYYTFYTIQLSELGYDKELIAWLWALGVLAEIGIFFWMAPLFKKFAVKSLILLGIGLTIIRWLAIGFVADELLVLVMAQLLHAFSFGLLHAAAIYLVDEFFTGRTHGRGQALYAASSHGLGGAVGMFIAGYAWSFGGAELAYSISAIAVFFSALIAWRWLR
ncbi:MFS transporter [Thiomicrorhabdus sediminis]|uniref:MFS transporter n=1 Tax=Thiomicrorhabdus sediminis TaxID=2580412 RepID=A0A4P9K6L7_9GAMM|nr:MFS transporter [Thiomicrorhabdus sediminis]QCU90528.1 MFS transporter [Thiomicrorhabdus sediminis]